MADEPDSHERRRQLLAQKMVPKKTESSMLEELSKMEKNLDSTSSQPKIVEKSVSELNKTLLLKQLQLAGLERRGVVSTYRWSSRCSCMRDHAAVVTAADANADAAAGHHQVPV